MAGVKFMVMYPRPQDIDTFEHLYQDEEVPIGDGLSSEYAGTFEAFEKLYQEEHVPMILDKLVGKTRFVATRVVGTSNGTRPPFYRIAEVYFPSLQVLAGVCAVRRRPGDRGPCRQDLQWRDAAFSCRGRVSTLIFGGISVWDRLKALVSRR